MRTDDPLMCADFDESPTPLFYIGGIASPVPPEVNRTVRPPGRSASNPMWSDGTSALAVATLDGKRTKSMGLNPSAKPGGRPFVNVGGLVGARVAFDNVLATASK